MEIYEENLEIKKLLRENKRKTVKTCVIIVIVATIVNMLMFVYFKSSIIDNISKEMTSEIATNVEKNVTTQVTDDVLSQYSRQYKIPENYTTIGTYVYETAGASVVEIYCESSAGTSTATGMIVNTDGYILTNAHVVTYEYTYRTYNGPFITESTRTEVHSKVYVRLKGETDWRICNVINFDENKDLAIIKLKSVTGLTLKPIVFGDSDRLSLGEGAVVIGNAYGLGISVTTGTITNTNPVNLKEQRDVIQTDTAINSGNSGGPLFDIGATCIGVATYKIVNMSTSSAGTEGLGFALSSNFAKEYLTSQNVAYNSI